MRWLAIGAFALAAGRIALNVVDSHVIDIGVAGRDRRRPDRAWPALYEGAFSPGPRPRGDVYGPFNYLAYVPFELIFPWDGDWGSVPAAHAAAIAFDLLPPRAGRARPPAAPGEQGRALGVGARVRLAACPWTLYTMNANANDALVAALVGRRDARAGLAAPAAASLVGLGRGGQVRARGAGAAVRDRDRRAALARGRSCSAVAFVAVAAVLVLPVHPRRRHARDLRPHPRLPGVPQLALQRLGPGAVAATSCRPPCARRRGAGGRGRLLPAAQDAGPGRRARGRGDDRRRSSAPRTGSTSTSSGSCRSCSSRVRRAARRRRPRAHAIASRSSPSWRRADASSSPGFSQTRGSRSSRRPEGVPVETMSPGSSVIRLERWATSSGIEKIRSAVDDVLHPLAVQVSANPIASSAPASSAVTSAGPHGRRAVEDLARHPLRRRELQVARREVVEQRVAGDVVDRVGLGNVLGAAADDERHLGLVVDLVARRRQLDRRAVGDQRVANLAKKVGRRRRLDAGLGRVGRVVQADADDLLGVGTGGSSSTSVERRASRRASRSARRAGPPSSSSRTLEPSPPIASQRRPPRRPRSTPAAARARSRR